MLLGGRGVRTGNKISLRLKYLPEHLITRPSLSKFLNFLTVQNKQRLYFIQCLPIDTLLKLG